METDWVAVWAGASDVQKGAYVDEAVAWQKARWQREAKDANPMGQAIGGAYLDCLDHEALDKEKIRQSITRFYGEPRHNCRNVSSPVFEHIQSVCWKYLIKSAEGKNFSPIAPTPPLCAL